MIKRHCAPVTQRNRVTSSYLVGRGFESLSERNAGLTQLVNEHGGMAQCIHCSKEALQRHDQCSNCLSQIRRMAMKQKIIEYKGGKCEHCGYDKHPAAMQFHHLDPAQKKFDISRSHGWSWDKLQPELDKCIMLCANCHFIEHALRYLDRSFVEASQNYALTLVTRPGLPKFKPKNDKPRVAWNKGKINVAGRKAVRPSSQELYDLLWSKPTTQIAKDYGVSDVAVGKWAKQYGLNKPPKGYWMKVASSTLASPTIETIARAVVYPTIL